MIARAAVSGGILIDELEREMEDWIGHHGDAVVRYLTLQTGDPEVAQDLAQETFARLYEFRRRHPGRRVSVSWLYTVGRRLVIDHWRAVNARPRTAPFQEGVLAPGAESAEGGVALREQVAAILHRMPEGERQCLLLFYFEDWSLETIAQTLRLSPVTVRVRLHRARTRFRGLWLDDEREEGGGGGSLS